MIDEADLNVTPKTPNNRAGYLFPEALLRHFLAYELTKISETVDNPQVSFIEELFHKDSPAVAKQVKDWFRENTNVPVTINYARGDISLPFISVVNAGEREKTEEASIGDYGGTAFYGSNDVAVLGGDPVARYTRELLTLPFSHTIKVFVAADDPTLTMYLAHVVFALLLVNKLDFDQYGGMRNLSFQASDIEHHPELFPDFAYFKVITLTFDSQFDVPMPKRGTIGSVNVSLSTFLGEDVTDDVKAGL